jgi:hypothetical protein
MSPSDILRFRGECPEWSKANEIFRSDLLLKPRPARVPAVYPTHAFLAFLAACAQRGMNNLRVCHGADGSIPTAPTNHPTDR